MSTKAIRVRRGDSSFLVEVDSDVQALEFRQVSPKKKGIPEGMEPVAEVRAVEREFSEIKELIVTVCNGLYETIVAIPKPETLEVEFGVKFGGEGGIPMITKATAEANFQIKIGWKPSQIAPSRVGSAT